MIVLSVPLVLFVLLFPRGFAFEQALFFYVSRNSAKITLYNQKTLWLSFFFLSDIY